ncbi:anti-sigma B factor antagonist [Ekhidna lutea]|uniref:Anti-sigma factor antagonist n=1 Tax=Ekhidna lutea TaxID=447679 RepID=A0A239FIU9_EKHLU|nr:STAS domain-containing protein [Ekhidna lutea]SNS56725.1 anti-sigma B factor antagonist [Ekhidna lutea]
MAEITTENKDGIHFITVNGEIDAGSSIYLDDALKNALGNGEKKIVADLSGLDYISSAGLGVFISHLDEFNQQKIQLTLFGINETVKQVFDILGLEKLLTIVESKEAAISSFNE